MFAAFRPRRGAIIIMIESSQPDRVVAGVLRELKDAARTQFTTTRPAVLVAQFLGSCAFNDVRTSRAAKHQCLDSPGTSARHEPVLRQS